MLRHWDRSSRPNFLSLTHSQYTDTGLTCQSTDPLTPGAWEGSHWSTIFLSHWYDSTWKKICCTSRNGTQVCHSRGRRIYHLANEAVYTTGRYEAPGWFKGKCCISILISQQYASKEIMVPRQMTTLDWWLRRPPWERQIHGSIPACTVGIFGGRVIPVTLKLAFKWLPWQALGIIGLALWLVGPMSIYSDWVRLKVWSATSVSVWQYVKNCLNRSVPEIHKHVGGTFSNQTRTNKHPRPILPYVHISQDYASNEIFPGYLVLRQIVPNHPYFTGVCGQGNNNPKIRQTCGPTLHLLWYPEWCR